jgi:hypothetical protein
MSNIIDKQHQLSQIRISDWINREVFSFQWWLLVAVLIIPWIIWWKCVDRKRLLEITLFGAIISIISFCLDSTLTELTLWGYQYKIFPVWPILMSVDFSMIPVSFMFVYQYFRETKKFIIAMAVVAAVFAFIAEPLLVWIGIYRLYKWEYFYSFPVYIVMGIFVRWLVLRLTLVQGK